MTDKERLESIGKGIKYLRGVSVGNVEWLIEKAKDNQMAIRRVDEIGTLALNRERDYKNLEKDYRGCNYLKKQYHNEMIRLQEENEHLKQAWEIAKTESLEWGAGKNIPNDDKELAYRIGAQDMHEDFVDYYEKSLEASRHDI